MMRREFCRAFMAATLLLPALSGCVQMSLSKKAAPPPMAIAPTPAPPSEPLYKAELTQSGPLLPELPAALLPNAQPAPPPQSEIVDTSKKLVKLNRSKRGRRAETEVADRDSHEKETKEKEAETNVAAANTPPAVTEPSKVTAPTPTGDTAEPTQIGQFTAGPTQDADESRRQASSLIQNTERGINSLRRNLSAEQVKTATQIRNFLTQAQRAIHNGDVDGAYTLATKAKLLLDELTGES
ncbi:MAG: hypothetical protein QOH85_1933 [Acidobacteriaceae bacterium]|jgi:hypothetical protein|nr:hypothetical protein [Acidobacteriaceae bacterium]